MCEFVNFLAIYPPKKIIWNKIVSIRKFYLLTRGLYRSNQGWLINADANGAANIGRKVAIMLGLDLSGISFRHFVNAFESPFMDLVKNPPHSCVGSVKDRIIQTKLKTKSEESNEFTRKFGNY